MLVLSRYRDESIYIGDDIVITVVDIRGDRIRIGVEAPSNISVHRQEVYEAIKKGQTKETSPQKGSRSPSSDKAVSGHLSQELKEKKSTPAEGVKGLPVSMDPPVEFGGLTSETTVL